MAIGHATGTTCATTIKLVSRNLASLGRSMNCPSRVEIDWDANPIELLPISDDSTVTLRVIWLRNGSDAHWSGREPNTMILDYLKTLPDPNSQRTGRLTWFLR